MRRPPSPQSGEGGCSLRRGGYGGIAFPGGRVGAHIVRPPSGECVPAFAGGQCPPLQGMKDPAAQAAGHLIISGAWRRPRSSC